MQGHQELEADLDRLRRAEDDPALGRDQLVRPREVRRVGVDAERAAKPLPAPRAGKECRPRSKGPAGQLVQRAPQRISVERARRLDVGQVEIAIEPAGERLLVPVEDGPVHEEQPLFGALPEAGWPRFGTSPCRTAASVSRFGTSAYQRTSCSTSALPGPNTTHDIRIVARTGTRELGEEVRERSLEDAGEHRIAGKLGFGRAPQDFLPRGERLAHIDRSGRQSGATKGSSDVVRDATPGKRG